VNVLSAHVDRVSGTWRRAGELATGAERFPAPTALGASTAMASAPARPGSVPAGRGLGGPARRSRSAVAQRDSSAFARRTPRLHSVSPLPISAAPQRDPAVAAWPSHSNALPSCALVTVRAADCCATSRAAIWLDGTAIARCPAMQNLRFLACVVAALGSLTAVGCGSSDNDCDNNNNGSNCLCDNNNNNSNNNCVPPGGVLRVENQSSFAITEIHVAPVGSTTWGANLISATLAPSATLTVTFTCGTFDVLAIDQAGQQCILHNVDLCANNEDFVIGSAACVTFTNH
jgi:hypothetical protein